MSDNYRQFAIFLKKNTINDPILGKLEYEEYDSPDSCKFDKHNNICDLPFKDIEVQANGDVYACCPGWNPASIGNLITDDLKSIWNGEKAKTLRNSITNGSYAYCNAKTCPAMIAGGGNRIIPKELFVEPVLYIPQNLAFSIDNTCNLVCPSCRTEKIIHSNDEFKSRALTILRRAFDAVFAEPHDKNVTFTFDGLGEIFFSQVYREIFETEEALRNFDKWPNFKVVLCTNGTMMTEKIQEKYEVLFKRLLGIRISIDAGDKASYEKVRCGGDWDLLWDNINYLYENTLKNNTSKSWAWNLILQKDNLESIPNLIKLAHNYSDNLPEIYIVNMLHWGTYSQEEFNEKAVWVSTSSQHERAKEILALPEVTSYPKIFIPNLN